MSDFELPWSQVIGMINHWARTPGNGYLGSDYGGDVVLKNI